MSVVRVLRPAAAVLLLSLASLAGPPPRSDATVVPTEGFLGTVDGFTSWYGAYDMASLGTAWCIDHGIAAPDPALDYRPVEPPLDAATRTAIAWLAGRHGFGAPAIDAAAMMLALHDLMGATYPSGRLDVDRLGPTQMTGFDGAEGAILQRARELKADAIAHSTLVGPLSLVLDTAGGAPGTAGTLRATVTDANGAPVSGVLIWATSRQAEVDAAIVATGSDGAAEVAFVAPDDPTSLDVVAVAPSLDPVVHAPTVRRAQRVIVPRQQLLEGQIMTAPPPPGRLRLDKVDHVTGQRLAGAVIEVHRGEPTGDGASLFTTVETTTRPTRLDLEQGTYWLVERAAPPGYTLDPSATPVEIRAGETIRISMSNEPNPPPSTTIVPPTTVPPTTIPTIAPPATTPPSTAVATGVTTTTVRPVQPTEKVEAPVALPRTGATTVPTALIGGGLVFVGIALTVGADIDAEGRLRPTRRWRRPPRRPSRPDRARSSAGALRTRRPKRPPSGGRR